MMKPRPLSSISAAELTYNREKYKLELSEAIYRLMQRQGIDREKLGELLNVSKGRISQILAGDDNFRAEKFADILLALGRTPHVLLGIDFEEVRIPLDEAASETHHAAAVTEVDHGQESFKIADYKRVFIQETAIQDESGKPDATERAETVWHQAGAADPLVRSSPYYAADG